MQVFDEWNKSELDSYLIEITAEILRYKDADNTALVTKIRDAAGQKGTGKWTGIAALDYGVPLTLIGQCVGQRRTHFTSINGCRRGSVCAMPVIAEGRACRCQ